MNKNMLFWFTNTFLFCEIRNLMSVLTTLIFQNLFKDQCNLESRTNVFIAPNEKCSSFTFYPGFFFLNCTIWTNKVCYISLKTDSVIDMSNFYLFKNLNWCAVVMVYAQMEIKHHAATHSTPSSPTWRNGEES